ITKFVTGSSRTGVRSGISRLRGHGSRMSAPKTWRPTQSQNSLATRGDANDNDGDDPALVDVRSERERLTAVTVRPASFEFPHARPKEREPPSRRVKGMQTGGRIAYVQAHLGVPAPGCCSHV